jgi:hypothetical protein
VGETTEPIENEEDDLLSSRPPLHQGIGNVQFRHRLPRQEKEEMTRDGVDEGP